VGIDLSGIDRNGLFEPPVGAEIFNFQFSMGFYLTLYNDQYSTNDFN
jgi:hypothetical protein